MNKKTLGILLGIFALLVVGGVTAYFQFILLAVKPVPSVSKDFPTQVIASELLNPDGIFDKTLTLVPIRSTTALSGQYAESELGKDDLTTLE